METRKENIEEIKKCIKECLHNDTTIKFFGGRSSGRTYELITAMSECLYELNKTNKELIGNQKSMKMTTDVLIRRIDKALDILDNYSIDYTSLLAGYENANDNIVNEVYSILKDGLDEDGSMQIFLECEPDDKGAFKCWVIGG